MNRFRLILLTLMIFFPDLCFAQYVSDTKSLRKIVSESGQAEVAVLNPGRRELDNISLGFSISGVTDNEVKIKLSPSDVEKFIDRRFEFRIIERPEKKGIISRETLEKVMEWDNYPSYSQYESIMRFYAHDYPSLCILDTIGTSVNGRAVLVLKISDNCSEDEPEPEVFYTSSMHGDETAGYVLMLRLAGYLLSNYSSDSRIRKLIDNLEIWINPLANPDGTYRDGEYIVSPIRNNANGYDLNRNFPDPGFPGIVQQKETLDMMRFLSERRFALSANFHSGEEVVNYPWDRWPFYHADNGWFYSVSRAWADTVHLHSEKGYMDFLDNGVTNGYSWYTVYGSRQDYVTYELSGRELTVELDTIDFTPEGRLADLWEYNYRSMLNYIENALYGIHGFVEDAVTGDPVPAMVFINGHDIDNSQVFADSVSGFFTRFLKPGLWDLSFTAVGYYDTTFTDIHVSDMETAFLKVSIRPILNPADTISRIRPYFYPNPASGFVKVVLPDYLHGIINVKIYNASGMIMSDFDNETVAGFPMSLDLRMLIKGTYFVVFRNKLTGRTGSGRFMIN